MDRKRCKTSIDEISPTNGGASNSHGEVLRSRDTDVTSSSSDKRRKFDQRNQLEDVFQLENQCRSGVDVISPEDVVSTAESGSGDRVCSSPCSRNELSLDLKAELRFEIGTENGNGNGNGNENENENENETSMSSNDGFSREPSPSSEICLDSDEMESSSTLKKKPAPSPATTAARKPSPAANTPSAAEIDEFFTVMEKKEQKRFADKYNFDIVKDEPMDGRYQWVLLKP